MSAVKQNTTKTQNRRITKSSRIKDVMSQHPETIPVFLQHNMHCIGCHAATFESIEAGARAHGMETKEIDEMVTQLNELLESEKPKKKKTKKYAKDKKLGKREEKYVR